METEQGTTLCERTATRDSIVGLPATLVGGCYNFTAITLEESELAFVNLYDLMDLVRTDTTIGLELVRAVGDEVLTIHTLLVSAMAATA